MSLESLGAEGKGRVPSCLGPRVSLCHSMDWRALIQSWFSLGLPAHRQSGGEAGIALKLGCCLLGLSQGSWEGLSSDFPIFPGPQLLQIYCPPLDSGVESQRWHTDAALWRVWVQSLGTGYLPSVAQSLGLTAGFLSGPFASVQ